MITNDSKKPVLSPKAFHGLMGEIVRIIEPHSEADPAALLIQGLIAFGNVVGRQAHFQIEADRHFTNLNAVIVGETSNGRKGTSWGRIRLLFEQVDFEWKEKCIKSGLTSGEGLIWHVRDTPAKCDEGDDQPNRTDPGVEDKRLLLVETEFASVLRVMNREGNTLSSVIRNAWDTGILSTLTKNQPAKASDAHISILGHITSHELNRCLSDTEAANGFGNRFLWVYAQRSKHLPHGSSPDPRLFGDAAKLLKESVDIAKTAGWVGDSSEAARFWVRLYSVLTLDRYGLFGAITSRSAPIVRRLALIYALLDKKSVIEVPHLEAAMAVWKYCEASCCAIFGDFLGDPLADRIIEKLRDSPLGLSRTEISNYLRNNFTRAAIERALTLLKKSGLADCLTTPSGGHPTETWYSTDNDLTGEATEEDEKAAEKDEIY